MSTEARHRVPGLLLLRLARMVFRDDALGSVVEPAIADFQRESTTAFGGRFYVRARGYAALWAVLLLAAFVPSAGAGAPVLLVLLGLNGGFLVAVLVPLLFAVLWSTLGVFTVAAPVAGLAFAFIVRAWNRRHPAVVAGTRRNRSKDPEINLSGIPVGGDAGGFLFMVASVLTMLGLPELRSFVAGTVLGGVALASGLFLWRRHHPESPLRRLLGSR